MHQGRPTEATFPSIANVPHNFSIFLPVFCDFPNGKKETVSITRRRMFARTLWRSRPLFAPMKSSCAKIQKSAARLLRNVPFHLPSSICHIHGVNVASYNWLGCFMFLDLLDSFGCELFSLSVLHFLNNLSMFSCVFCVYRLEQKHSVRGRCRAKIS